MSVPTKTAAMREAIILALADLHFGDPEEGGFLESDIQFRIWYQLEGDTGYWSDGYFGDRSSAGKAYERAMQQLRDEGVVITNPDDPNQIERALAAVQQVKDDQRRRNV